MGTKLKADREQSKAARNARLEQERLKREKEVEETRKQLRQLVAWCWHCGCQGHVKADCAKFFEFRLERECAEVVAKIAEDDDARSDSTKATASEIVPQRKGRKPRLSPAAATTVVPIATLRHSAM